MSNCNICTKHFSRPDAMRRHVKFVHQGSGGGGGGGGGGGCGGGGGGSGGGEIPPGISPTANDFADLSRKSQLGHGKEDFFLQHPFTMTIAAPTGFGKTFWLKNVLENAKIQPPIQRIIWCYGEWQPLYEKMKKSIPNIEFVSGIPQDLENSNYFDVSLANLIVFDDLMREISKDERIVSLWTKGSHHKNLSCVCLLQDFYFPNTQTIRRNSHYINLFNMPNDKRAVRTISGQMFPNNPSHMLDAYQEAVSRPYGSLLIDLKPNTFESDRLRPNVLTEAKSHHKKTPIPFIEEGEEKQAGQEDIAYKTNNNFALKMWQWLCDSDPNPGCPDELFLLMVREEDKKGIKNPLALAHLAGMYAREHTQHQFYMCPCREQKSAQAFYYSPCSMCGAVDLYLKMTNTQQQVVQCPHDQTIFTTTWDTCHYTVGLCLGCMEALVVNHQHKKKRGVYPELDIKLQQHLL
jgi:hypothetical protein